MTKQTVLNAHKPRRIVNDLTDETTNSIAIRNRAISLSSQSVRCTFFPNTVQQGGSQSSIPNTAERSFSSDASAACTRKRKKSNNTKRRVIPVKYLLEKSPENEGLLVHRVILGRRDERDGEQRQILNPVKVQHHVVHHLILLDRQEGTVE